MSKQENEVELVWMSTRDICDHLRITPRTLERYRKRGDDNNPFPQPDCSYMGGSNKYLKSKVSAWQVMEMARITRKPMSHLNVKRDGRGRVIRPDEA